jgi:hypothetical protein
MTDLFKIKEIFPITSRISADDEDSEELSEVDRITHSLELGYEIDWGYWDVVSDPIFQMHPRCVIKKGNTNKKYYTEVVFQSGNIAYAACKPDDLMRELEGFTQSDSPPKD